MNMQYNQYDMQSEGHYDYLSDPVEQYDDGSYEQDPGYLSDELFNSSPSPPEIRRPAFSSSRHRPFSMLPPTRRAQAMPVSRHEVEDEQLSLYEQHASENHYHAYHRPHLSRNPQSYAQGYPSYRETYAPYHPPTSDSQHRGQAVDPPSTSIRNSSGIRLRPVSDLPDMFRAIFKFGVFNAVQSTCYDTVMKTSENIVVSAPTGSGKTVLFELGMVRMISDALNSRGMSKCVYVAPTKALCSERYRDWSAKLTPLGIQCCELTGDTVPFGKGIWGDAKKATIIVTTGEKWDSLTRNWNDHQEILSQIQLFLVDEVHILNESRGSTLEVIVSRMRFRGTNVRFIMVSATAPNIEDIAAWIGSHKDSQEPAKVFQFDESYRPCKLTRIIVPVNRPSGQNDFAFMKILDAKLFQTLLKHSSGKPILIFCSTRKGVFTTAEQLAKEYEEAQTKRKPLPWASPKMISHSFHDKRLSTLTSAGIGAHNAGMSLEDRRAIEDLYLKGTLRVVVSTSTLAVGINLPAHTVVIKGVKTFQNNAMVEYSDLDVMQMLGRAGRPQFDKEGVAIIMCESELEGKYRDLISGSTTLESSLNLSLSEHLNSEIGLGTIMDVRSAKEWLATTFLFQRMQRNPRHYSIDGEDGRSWQDRVEDMILHNVSILEETELITHDEAKGKLSSTEYGDIMSKFYIRQATMKAILALQDQPTLRDVLDVISNAEELSSDNLRATEKTPLNNLRQHNDIRFEVKKPNTTAEKVNLLIQAVLGGISLNDPEYKTADSQLNLQSLGIFQHLSRIGRAIVEVAIAKKNGAQLKYALELLRAFSAKAWDDRPILLRQIPAVGEKTIKVCQTPDKLGGILMELIQVLAENNITSFDDIRRQEPHRIEMLLNRRPPFGLELLASLADFPMYTLGITELNTTPSEGGSPVMVDLLVECTVKEPTIKLPPVKKSKHKGFNITDVLTLTSDMDFIDFRRIPTKLLKEKKSFEVTARLEKPSQSILVYITSENIAGVTVSKTHRPSIPSSSYPTRNTKPLSSLEADLQELEQDSDFWDKMNADDSFEDLPEDRPIRDLSAPKPTARKTATLKANDPPKRLYNGNYECNHNCKDKQKCRHLCCREGLEKQPKPRQSPKKPTAETSKSAKSKDTNAKKRQEHTWDQLENMNQKTNNLQLLKGQRLKLDSDPIATHKLPPKPTAARPFPEKSDEEDEELPEASELLRTGPHRHKRQLSVDLFEEDAMVVVEHEVEGEGPAQKKARFNTPVSAEEPLFLDDPEEEIVEIFDDDEQREDPQEEDDVPAYDPRDYMDDLLTAPTEELDDYTIDSSYIEKTPELTLDRSSSTYYDESSAEALTVPVPLSFCEPEEMKEDDLLADLEAWFQTGSVEIVDD